MRCIPQRLKPLLFLLAIGVWAAPAVASAPVGAATATERATESRTESERLELLLMVLRAHEYTPNPKVLARIGTPDQITRLLIQTAGRKVFRATIRARAVATLYVYPTLTVRRFLLSVVHERSNIGTPLGLLLRKQAVRTLGRAFGKSVVSELAALRSDRNAQLREGVAYALGDTGAREALAPLKAWLPHERELFVRVAIDKAIDVLRKRGR